MLPFIVTAESANPGKRGALAVKGSLMIGNRHESMGCLLATTYLGLDIPPYQAS